MLKYITIEAECQAMNMSVSCVDKILSIVYNMDKCREENNHEAPIH